ncbi:MFS transporter [Ktedonobacter sp. SOSP1-52]|uniref:MFS transporter n=1 Tax=Ktedonobacter sp. SOSP1-52 TaxID=2778366 RepID=UPI0019152A3E|nr:MFS transporter [Ktedonobacter sp. SOSP1-52]GHO62071.1 MFS transporter [Ktedonobacter sp. SOSP1-52]
METIQQHVDKPGTRPRPLWRNMHYLLLAGGQGISSLGTYTSNFAIPLLALAVTGSAAQAGLLIGIRSLVMNLLSLLAGALADRWNRKRLMIICEWGNAIVTGSIPVTWWLGHLTLIHLYIAATLQGALFVFYQMAESAALRRVVPREQLASASGQNEVINSLGIMVGPLIGGLLYSLSPMLPFVLDTASFVISAISLLCIRINFHEEAIDVPAQNIVQDIKEGLNWLWHEPLVRFLGILTAGLMVPCAGYSLLMVVFAQSLHANTVETGYVFAAGGLGSVLGALLAAPLQKWLGFKRLIIWSAWIWAGFWLIYIIAPNPLILAAMNCVGYAIVPIYMVAQYSYRVARVPDRLQGRVNSVFRLVAFGGQPLGIAMTGVLLQYLGPITTIWITFVPQFVVALAATFNRALSQARPIEKE